MIKRSEMQLLAAVLMIITIIGVAAFQGYWLRKLYVEEWNSLKKETDVAFRDVIYNLQLGKYHKNTTVSLNGEVKQRNNLYLTNMLDSAAAGLRHASNDSLYNHRRTAIAFRANLPNDTIINLAHKPGMDIFPGIQIDEQEGVGAGGNLPYIIRYFTNDPIALPMTIGAIDTAYRKALLKSNITADYRLQQVPGKEALQARPIPKDEMKTGFLFLGQSNDYAYQAVFPNPFPYILRKIRLPIIISILLLAFTPASLIFLYRNLVQQRQIAAIKNEFISNMTHELKTPLSTVTVAVEALRHFGALEDPERAKEYLDISALELQRLSLLVDKVLKLSLFENQKIELKPERIDLAELTAEVMASMKLPMEKAGAVVGLTTSGEGLFVRADRMHLTSVISNLIDNAIKYSRDTPVLSIHLSREGQVVRLAVADNGIGIPTAYTDKIFEKFFRVPSGDRHNIKGYGLGLSYVHHIVTRHEGQISVESREGKGSTFTIQLPAA